MTPAERPLSPHLQIYRPQFTSLLSISHRASGLALAAGTLLLVWWLVAAAAGPSAFATAQGVIGSWLGQLVLFGWTVALYFHLCNGIRHLAWDAGYGFELDNAYASAIAVGVATAVLSVATWVVGCLVM